MNAALRAFITKKTTLLLLVGLLVLIVGSMWAYSKARVNSYSKIEPYTIKLVFSTEDCIDIAMAYDYGYGVTQQHTRSIKLDGKNQIQTLELSLSAWKPLLGLKFIASDGERFELISVDISRGEQRKNFLNTDLLPSIEGENTIYDLSLSDWAG